MGVRTAILCAVALAACTRARTEIIVVTSTDYAVPGEVDEFRIEVTGPRGEVQTSVARLGDGEPAPPRTLGLVHEDGPLGPFRVRARALFNGTTVVERLAEVEFQSGRTLVLRLDLLQSCEDVACGTDETCGEDGCRSIIVGEDELEEWNGNIPGLDAGPGTDAGMNDAGMNDAGMNDAGMCPPETCNGMDDDCDSMIDETFDLTSDPMNCGACGDACIFTNATGDCVASMCEITACDTGFDDCDGNAANGCESDVSMDPDNCGSCGNNCTGMTRNCCDGTCCR